MFVKMLAKLLFERAVMLGIFTGNLVLAGVVGCGRGVGYLTSPGRPIEIGFQLGKACYPWGR